MRPRIPPIERADADPRSEAQFARIESLGGYVPNMHLTFGSHPELYSAWLPFAVHVMPNSSLPARDRQILILATSLAWRAIYPWAHHARISETLRALSADEVSRIADGPEHAAWSATEAALIRACLETRSDGRISEHTWPTLAAHYDARQLLDVVFTIGQYGLIASALNSLGVELEAGFEPPAWSKSSPGDARIVVSPPGFSDWPGLLALLHAAYAYMEPRIDPPSSLLRMDAAQLEVKARDEALIVALEGRRLVGCAFASLRDDCVYVGKLAVDESVRRRGLARELMRAAETLARANARAFLELETRIELTENHATFAALGFSRVGESAHPGFDRPTSIRMRKPVPA